MTIYFYEIKGKNFKTLKLSEKNFPEGEREKLTDSYHAKAVKSLNDYNEILLRYKEGFIDKYHKDELCTKIYQESGYSDIWDFMYDLKRFQVGLPINITFKLFRKEDI